MKTKNTTKVAENQVKTAVAFYRVSTDKQDNERQIEDVRKYCKAYSFELTAEYKEIISGASKLSERKELKAMLEYIEKNKPDYVICSELSRLARSQDALTIIRDWTKKGIAFITLKEGIRTIQEDGSTNPMTELLLSILNAINVFELETIKYRVKSGLRKTVNSGTWSGGIVPFGYYLENKQLVINESEGETIRFMFSKYAEGWGSYKIAAHLNRAKTTTKQGYMWRDTTVVKVLNNTIYKGKRTWNGEEMDTPDTRIVDDTTFAAVQERLNNKSNVTVINKQQKNSYLLQGLIKCSCGQHFAGRQRDNIYMCKTKKYGSGCGTKSVNISWLDEEIKTNIVSNYKNLVQDNTKIIGRTIELKAEMDNLTENLKNEKAKQNNLINNIDRIGQQNFEKKFDVSKEYSTQLQNRIDEISVKINQTQQYFDNLFQSFNKNEKNNIDINIDRDLILRIVERIEINNETVIVSMIDGSNFEIARKQRKTA